MGLSNPAQLKAVWEIGRKISHAYPGFQSILDEDLLATQDFFRLHYSCCVLTEHSHCPQCICVGLAH